MKEKNNNKRNDRPFVVQDINFFKKKIFLLKITFNDESSCKGSRLSFDNLIP